MAIFPTYPENKEQTDVKLTGKSDLYSFDLGVDCINSGETARLTIEYYATGSRAVDDTSVIDLYRYNESTGNWDKVDTNRVVNTGKNTLSADVSSTSIFAVLAAAPFSSSASTAGILFCPIATATYGSPMAQEVKALCKFRDRYLNPHPVGRFLVNSYYKVGPKAARFIDNHPAVKPFMRKALKPVVSFARWMTQEKPGEGTNE
jgi:hypothetical protein